MSNSKETLEKISKELALAGLKIGAIKIRPNNPFLWASGTYNPIYNDNRMFLWHPEYRQLIADGFIELMEINHLFDVHNLVIAGTSTSGIPLAERIAESLFLPEIYIRDKPKDHGLKNQIEGIDAEDDLSGYIVPLFEDLISTGGSSVKSVEAIRNAGGICNNCFSIFNYGLSKAKQMFAGEIPFDKEGHKLISPCEVGSILYYPDLLKIGIEHGFIDRAKENMLNEWMENQESWGVLHGFPPVLK